MPHHQPDFWRNLRRELAIGPHWIDRAVVLTYAIGTGLVVVFFTHFADYASIALERIRGVPSFGPWIALAIAPAMTAAIVWWTRRFAPGSAGSGIPQVLAATDDTLTETQRSKLVSVPLSLHKIGLVVAGIFAGLSIGREGPTVQVGAGLMRHAKRWLSPHAEIDAHDLMVAGAAAGIAAAFNTPLGGVVFALEQLSKRRSISQSGLVILAIVLSGLVSVSFFGNLTYFGELTVTRLEWSYLAPGIVVAFAAGLSGGLFSRLVVICARGMPDRFSRWKAEHPVRFAAGCGLAVGLIGLASGGATLGAGYAPTRALLEGHGDVPAIYTLLKFVATWLSQWAGVPAGVFAPSLSIGAGIGHDVAMLWNLPQEAAIPLIAIGMVGFLAAATQEPLTAFIIVMEMVSGHSMVLSLMATSLLASGVSRWVTRPLYPELATLLVPPRVTVTATVNAERA